jgi:AcrR family transcriptional regulator
LDEDMSRPSGRPRDTDDRILDAAITEYAERGAAGFTFTGVARRAGVGKSALYLRWPDKDALLTDAVWARSADLEDLEDVDTGTLAGDLAALARNLLAYWLEPAGWVTLRIAVDAFGPGSPYADNGSVIAAHRAAARAITDRAVERASSRPRHPSNWPSSFSTAGS